MVRVLLVEDHEIVRRGIRGLLESHPAYEICGEARDGQAAVDLAGRLKPDVAILDYSLPALNGIESARNIKKVSPQTQILIFTQHDSDDLIRDALLAGARGFLLKSEADDHLLHALAALSLNRPYFTARVSEAMLAGFIGGSSGQSSLTSREREVVQLIAEAYSTKEIADRLRVSGKTVETHRAAAMRKLGVRNIADLVRYAIRHKMVEA